MKVLITGGAGFIGSHVAKELIQHGYTVRALDNLSPQVHGGMKLRPDYLDPAVELVVGDVRDASTVGKSLEGIDAVIHLAAAVGVPQSMYEIEHYVSTNNHGTAVLLEEIVKRKPAKLVVASSVTIYGEGMYQTPEGGFVPGVMRTAEQLKSHQWEIVRDGKPLMPLATPETKEPSFASIYALSKYDQERMCLMVGDAYGIPSVALRLFNVYGPHQSLSNPYAGVLAIFASRLRDGHAPLIYEDGNQSRDFVSVYDIARAFRLALERPEAEGETFNIGSGKPHTVLEAAQHLARALGKEIEPEISSAYRVGDIRHCFADISKAGELLGYAPEMDFEEGLQDLTKWFTAAPHEDMTDQARSELAERGLIG